MLSRDTSRLTNSRPAASHPPEKQRASPGTPTELPPQNWGRGKLPAQRPRLPAAITQLAAPPQTFTRAPTAAGTPNRSRRRRPSPGRAPPQRSPPWHNSGPGRDRAQPGPAPPPPHHSDVYGSSGPAPGSCPGEARVDGAGGKETAKSS